MGSENRPVCHRCAQIKQACDGSLPCARCVRLSLPCRPRDSSEAGGVGVDGQKGDMPKARIRRVQTGCLMCKRRKKKCDEAKPRCGDCRRLCLDCAWPERRTKDKASAAAASSSPSSTSSSSAAASVMAMAPTPPREKYIKTETEYSSPPMMMMKTAEVKARDVVVAFRDSRSPPPSLSSSRGDYSVHYRHDDSSGRRVLSSSPSNVSSEYDGGLLSLASPPKATWMDSYHTPVSYGSPPDDYCVDPTNMTTMTTTNMTTSGSLTLYVPQVLPQLSASQDRALLHHYRTIVSAILSRRPSLTNPYNNHLLPLASCNDTILHCILALSASHWRKLQPQLADRGLHHKSRATQALARLLPHVGRSKASVDVALVCCLLLCMTELFDGTSEGWKLHLKGAKKLLTTLMSQQGGEATAAAVPRGHHKFLLRLAKFLDSAATVSTCRPPLMGEDMHEAATLDRLTAFAHADDDDDEGAVYGIPKELFHLVDVINALADKRKTRVDEASERLFRDEAARVEDRINGWAATAAASTTTTPGCDGCQVNDRDILQATAAYEHALRLRLHQIVEGYGLDDGKVVVHVDGILDSVQRIRYGSPLEACLLFPLVMAGGACWTVEQRMVIYDRLMVMERTCGFGYIYNARDLVQRVWKLRDETEGTGVDVNWARIRYEEMHGLVVF